MYSKLLDSPLKVSIAFSVVMFVLLMVWYYRAKQPGFITYKDETTGEIHVSAFKATKLGVSVSLISGLVVYIILRVLSSYNVGILGMGNTCSSCVPEDDFLN